MTDIKHSASTSAIRRDRWEDRNAGSFLVRVWYEAREVRGEEPSFRGYIRNLQTGQERFVRDPETMSDVIRRQVAGGSPVGEHDSTEKHLQRRAVR